LQDVNKTGPEAPVSVPVTLHKNCDKIQPTEHITESKRVFLYM